MAERLELIRRGDIAGTLDALADPPDATSRGAVRALRERMLSSPIGHRDPAWLGALTEDHVDAVQFAHLAGMPAERAASLGGLSRRVADTLPRLFPDELPVFVATWSRLYQRNPKNWDRNAHYPAMFGWVKAGLVPAPTEDGAVNLWLTFAPWLVHPRAAPGPGEPAGLVIPGPDECPELYTVTLPRLFEAEVRPGLGAAAFDQSSGGEVSDLIIHLVDTHVWDRGDTLARIEQALAHPDRASAFQQRWLHRLAAALAP